VIHYDDFASLFPLADAITGVEPVPASMLPEPYCGLLNHTKHMTVTVEKYFRDTVDVEVEDWDQDGDFYSRRILLRTRTNKQYVQFGVVRIDLSVLTEPVRQQILSGRLPLGRVLIDHNVLTDVKPVAFLKVSLGPRLTTAFDCQYPATTFARIGQIAANGRPAIDVLEVLRPIS
jgi:chorismate-pyruvate lyase